MSNLPVLTGYLQRDSYTTLLKKELYQRFYQKIIQYFSINISIHFLKIEKREIIHCFAILYINILYIKHTLYQTSTSAQFWENTPGKLRIRTLFAQFMFIALNKKLKNFGLIMTTLLSYSPTKLSGGFPNSFQ